MAPTFFLKIILLVFGEFCAMCFDYIFLSPNSSQIQYPYLSHPTWCSFCFLHHQDLFVLPKHCLTYGLLLEEWLTYQGFSSQRKMSLHLLVNTC